MTLEALTPGSVPWRTGPGKVVSVQGSLWIQRPPDMSDVGPQALAIFNDHLSRAAPVVILGQRGLAWGGARLCATVTASYPSLSRGFEVCRLAAFIGMLGEVTAPASEVETALVGLNASVAGSAYVYDRQSRTLGVLLGHDVHEEILRSRSLEIASSLVVALVQAEAELLDPRFPFDGALYPWPEAMLRRPAVVPGVAEALVAMYQSHGQEPSRFSDADQYEAAMEAIRATNGLAVTLGGSPELLCVEVAFGEDDTTLIEVFTDTPHPVWGAGVLVRTTVRMQDTLANAAAAANHLNFTLPMIPGEVPCLGAWTSRELGGAHYLAHRRFIPNFDAGCSSLPNALNEAIARAVWIDGHLHPGAKPREASDIVLRRIERSNVPLGDSSGD